MKKDIEWFKKDFDRVLGQSVSSRPTGDFKRGHDFGWAEARRTIYALASQLDEPEVLSQEWIGEHTWNNHYIGRPFVYVDDLQNLLVPKQEKVEVPRFVADILEENTFADLPTAFEELFSANAGYYYGEDVCKWIVSNDETFARAWLDGFTVEVEQKYRVLDGNTTLLGRINGLMLTTVEILEYYPEYAPTFDLTEQEIKDYDPRYWPFAVKVEELEE